MTELRKPETESETESFLEDVLGFNFRSIRTLRDLIVRPNTVFKAYAARDRQTYTPSLRLWLGLIGIQILVSVFWGGYGGIIVAQFQSQSPEQLAALENVLGAPIEAIAEPYGEAASFLHPILVGGFTALSAFLIGAFNKSLPWTARINITFGILSASSLAGMIMLLFIIFGDAVTMMSWMIVPVALFYWLIFTLGAPGILATTRTGAIIKGGIFAAVTMLLVMIGGIVMSLLSFTYAASVAG